MLSVVRGQIERRTLGRSGGAVRIAEHRNGGYPLAPSPDGKSVYYTGGRTDPSIWRAEVESGKEEKVLEGLLPGCWACWALGKEGLYYIGASTATGTDARLVVFDLETKKAKVLAEIPQPMPPLGTGALSVAPDGRRFLMVRVNRPNADVIRVEGFR